jgi:zinc/manganese transport system substrate-binding protein
VVLKATASIDAWGSIVAQLGGTHVATTSIVGNPDTDPHDYEPTPGDARAIASSDVFVENGIGYDSWAAKVIAASPSVDRAVIDVGHVVGVPEGGNPHRWYSPTDVGTVADAITSAFKRLDPADAAYFDAQRVAFETTGLAEYHRLIDDIRTRYSGTKVGASESIFAPLLDAVGLDLITPPSFLKAISDGTDPNAADRTLIDTQISAHQLEVYLFNVQNATPDVTAQVDAARKAGIPVATATETLSPRGATFQDWQSTQLRGLAAALREATGR